MTSASDLDEPLFHIVRTTDRAMRTWDGRWTTHRIGAGMWTREEAEHIDKVVLVGSYAVDIIPEGTSPYAEVQMDWTRDVPQTKAWVLWINFVRDEYAKIHNIHSREATARIYALPKTKADMLIGLFNSQTGHYEAAKQIGA